jgi:hypothetical protein
VLHFVYLTASDPLAFTSDHFIDLKTLKLEPHFEKAMEQAFNPLGVYLNFWHPTLNAAEPHDYTIAVVNDEDRPRAGKLRLVFTDDAGKETAAEETPFSLAPLGTQSYLVSLKTPSALGDYSLQAIAMAEDESAHPVISRRDVLVVQAVASK